MRVSADDWEESLPAHVVVTLASFPPPPPDRNTRARLAATQSVPTDQHISHNTTQLTTDTTPGLVSLSFSHSEIFPEMAGVAVETGGVTVVNPASPGRPNYLKSYPYLFVRETDQTDYFCTVCEESLTEDQLQSHLFDTHSAENLQVSPQSSPSVSSPLLSAGLLRASLHRGLWVREQIPLHLCGLLG